MGDYVHRERSAPSEFGVDEKCINKLVVVRSASQMKRSAS